MININNFEKIKSEAEKFYKEIGHVFCPYFKEKINFNSEGLEHLKFKRRREARSRKDQYMRFRLLKLAPIILNKTTTLQGIWETKSIIRIRVNNRTDSVLGSVCYYEFIAVIDSVRIKIILKRVDNGQVFFWSIISYWGMNKDQARRKLHSGYPDED